MHLPTDNTFDLRLVWQNIVHRPLRWIVPAAVVSALALGYAVFRAPTWEASQAMVIRDEAVGRVLTAQGKFASVDDMQTAQETVLQLAKSSSVVETALKQVGPRRGKSSAGWPTVADVADLQRRITVKAPNGAEFGRTEVFYLIVKDSDRPRSLQLAGALCDAVQQRLSQLRDQKAQSLVAELAETAELARTSLDEATGRLAKLESSVGGDLAELRILNESSSGESTLRRTMTNIRDEMRNENKAQLANQQLLELLVQSQGDAQSIVAMPSQLLQSQPALQRLKDGLVDAQLRTSQALSSMSREHPRVKAAMAEEEDVRRRLHGELDAAIGGLRVELSMNDRRIASLSDQLGQLQQRMNDIAAVRADYENLSAEVQEHSKIWTAAQKDLADAQASRAAAHSASLLTRLDGPQTGACPAGMSRAKICLAGLGGGLLLGLGVVILTATPVVLPISENTEPAADSPRQVPVRRPASQPLRNLTVKEALARIAFGFPSTANQSRQCRGRDSNSHALARGRF